MPAGVTYGWIGGAAEGGWAVGELNGPVRWRDHRIQELGDAFGRSTDLLDINSSGVAVGDTFGGGTDFRPVVHRDGVYENLPLPPGVNSGRALEINNVGDILGLVEVPGGQDLALWPAAQPGTVQRISLDPVYGAVLTLAIDEQRRILLTVGDDRGGWHTTGLIISADHRVTEIPQLFPGGDTAMTYGWRNGRAAGVASPKWADRTAVEWNATGTVVHQLSERAMDLHVDSGDTIAGVIEDSPYRQRLGIWRSGVLEQTIVTTTDASMKVVTLTDDGALVVTMTSMDRNRFEALVFQRTC